MKFLKSTTFVLIHLYILNISRSALCRLEEEKEKEEEEEEEGALGSGHCGQLDLPFLLEACAPLQWLLCQAPWPLAPAAATAAKSLQSCPTLCDPIEAAHQAPPSLGFSRQEHWSGFPFPSPMHESEK